MFNAEPYDFNSKNVEENVSVEITLPSAKISAETIANKVDVKKEGALSYDEISQNVIANKQTEIETQNNNSLNMKDSGISRQKTDKRFLVTRKALPDELSRIEIVENQAKEKIEKLHSSDKFSGKSEIKSLVKSESESTPSLAVQNIKLEKNKITDIKSHIDSLKGKELINNSKSSTNLSVKKKVSRAFLAKRIIDKEPVDIIKSPVIVSNNITTKLYYFTEILNRSGEDLYQYWMWEGNIELEKQIKISENRWRAASLKTIPNSKTGLWEVRLVNQDGDILNEIQFEVVKE